MSVLCHCLVCGKEFPLKESAVKKGKGKFCSPNCYNSSRISLSVVSKRFWVKVDKNTCLGDICGCQKGRGHCWPWIGASSTDGYGQTQIGGYHCHPSRLAFYLMHERWPNPSALHHCDNKPCCRPEHIYEGTHQQNMQDMYARNMQIREKQRNARLGEKAPTAKLCTADVKLLRAFRIEGIALRPLSEVFDIGIDHVCAITLFQSWKHIK